MFFPDRITRIGASDRVLEVGPGGLPFGRADVLLDLAFDDEELAAKQRGGALAVATGKPTYFYDGGRFPFDDNEFDYVVCSHVVEHVADVEDFLSELSRVASRGYIEFPTTYYEMLFNFSVHTQFVANDRGVVVYLDKKLVDMSAFRGVQRLMYRALELGHSSIVDASQATMFDGFEWEGCIEGRRASSLEELYNAYPVQVSAYLTPPRRRIGLLRRGGSRLKHEMSRLLKRVAE